MPSKPYNEVHLFLDETGNPHQVSSTRREVVVVGGVILFGSYTDN